MNKYLCIHGHFYQPPRENPWLEEVERQDSAYPYHDWNERITSECYAPNAATRMLDDKGRIKDITSNYDRISFNFGPTLLSWMKAKEPDVYQRILQADRESVKKFSGHGAALAQSYNHLIMPLANRRDKITQVIWGIRDFESHFQRKPEGMWLSETAVDTETLEILVDHGIKFTILAPRQAKRFRKIHHGEWKDTIKTGIDPRRAYTYPLPSGRSIALFFYDGPVSQAVAFEKLLQNGELFAGRLTGVFDERSDNQLVHIATDGETYGHHHRDGDMALAYCLYHIEQEKLAKITIYAEYLEKFPPEYEVEIHEKSSWSCVHGVERWRENCGCSSGGNPGWTQEWRSPLRGALDWLRDNLIHIYEEQLADLLKDCWEARDDYIGVCLDRSPENVDVFLERHAVRELEQEERVRVLQLMEMQRFSMLMYTSCGWFFDEISGIETVQVIQYAARAIQLADRVSGISFETTFKHLLEKAPSNIEEFGNGARVYERFVEPAVSDLKRVAAHYAISSLFEDYQNEARLYTYSVENQKYELLEFGKQKLALGSARICSRITGKCSSLHFAALHMGDHNFMGGILEAENNSSFDQMVSGLKSAFRRGDTPSTIQLIRQHFPDIYSLWHLFRDEQMKILYQVLGSTLEEVEASLRQLNEHHYAIIQVIKQLGIPLPKILANTVLVTLNSDLLRVIGQDPLDFERLHQLVTEVNLWSLEIDRVSVEFLIRKRINQKMNRFKLNTENPEPLRKASRLMTVTSPLNLKLDRWHAQNVFFQIAREKYPWMSQRAREGDPQAGDWCAALEEIAKHLHVVIPNP